MPVLLSFALLMVAFALPSYADQWDKKTIATFSQQIEVPGAVLPAGTYVFKLVDSQSDRHIVRIMNERENKVFATILAIPSYRMETPSKTIFTFYEMPAGQAEVMHEWFYPGDNYGQEFAYGKKRQAEILAATKLVRRGSETEVQVASAATTTTTTTTEETTPKPVEAVETAAAPTAETTAPAVADNDNEKLESPSAEAATEEAQSPAPAPEPTPAPSDQDNMPKTASELALIGLFGVLAALAAFGMRQYRGGLR